MIQSMMTTIIKLLSMECSFHSLMQLQVDPNTHPQSAHAAPATASIAAVHLFAAPSPSCSSCSSIQLHPSPSPAFKFHNGTQRQQDSRLQGHVHIHTPLLAQRRAFAVPPTHGRTLSILTTIIIDNSKSKLLIHFSRSEQLDCKARSRLDGTEAHSLLRGQL